MRKLLKSVTVPPVCWADVPLHDPKGSTTTFRCARDVCVDHGSRLQFVTLRGPTLAAHVAVAHRLSNSMRLTDREVAINGVHGDGVPHQRGTSVECFSSNFAQLPVSERVLAAVTEKGALLQVRVQRAANHRRDEKHQANTFGKCDRIASKVHEKNKHANVRC